MLGLKISAVLHVHELVADRKDKETPFLGIAQHAGLDRQTGENADQVQGIVLREKRAKRADLIDESVSSLNSAISSLNARISVSVRICEL